VGRADAEGALHTAVAEDEDEELVLCLGIGADDDDDAVAEQLGELDLAERRRAHDPPRPLNPIAGDLGDARLRRSGSEDDELLAVRERAAGVAPPPLRRPREPRYAVPGRHPLLGRFLLHLRALRS